VVSPRRRESGYALLTSLLVLFLVSVSLALLGAALHLRMKLVQHEVVGVHLVALADGVLAETLGHLYADPGFAGVAEHPLGRGKVKSRVESLGGGLYRVWGTATQAGRARDVYAEVSRTVRVREVMTSEGVKKRPEVRVEVTRWRRVTGSGAGGDEGRGGFE
jgi:hypothetical protein